MTGQTQPGRNGGTLRKGGGGAPRRISADFFKVFEVGDEKLNLLPRAERLAALLICEDLGVRLRAEQLLLEYQYGKPAQTVEVTGDGATVVRYVVEVPPEETKEQWRARQESARAKAAAAEDRDVN